MRQLTSLSYLNGDLPLAFLYSQEIRKGPTTLFKVLRDWMILKGDIYKPWKETNNIPAVQLIGLFKDGDDKYMESENFYSSKESSRKDSCSSETPHTDINYGKIMAHNISSRFRQRECFTGKLVEYKSEYIWNNIDG